jgi:transcriptional regulator with XRE-family HTH domain
LREHLRMTPEDLAALLEVSPRAVRRWEQGEKLPRKKRTIRILNAHGRDHGMPPIPLPAQQSRHCSLPNAETAHADCP